MLRIIYKGEDAEKVKKEAQKAFDFVAKVFSVKISNVTVCVHSTRDSYNKRLGKKTEDWNIANADDNKRIDILSPRAFTKESCHSKMIFYRHWSMNFLTYLFSN